MAVFSSSQRAIQFFIMLGLLMLLLFLVRSSSSFEESLAVIRSTASSRYDQGQGYGGPGASINGTAATPAQPRQRVPRHTEAFDWARRLMDGVEGEAREQLRDGIARADLFNHCDGVDLPVNSHTMYELVLSPLNNNVGSIHVFKSGGTTVNKYLTTASEEEQKRIMKQGPKAGPEQPSGVLLDSYHFGPHNWEWDAAAMRYVQRAWVSYVRDPVKRAVSAFKEDAHRNKWQVSQQNFDLYFRKNTHRPPHVGGQSWHFFPQVDFLKNSHGAVDMAYLGLLEDMAPTLRIIGPLLFGVDPNKPVGHDRNHLKQSGGTNEIKVSDDQVRTICKVFWQDYKCLGFELPVQCRVDSNVP